MEEREKTGQVPLFRGILAVLIFVFIFLLFAPPELVNSNDSLRSFVIGVRSLLHLN